MLATMDASARHAATLELDGLTKRFDPDHPPAVDELTLSVPAGEVCVFIGPSGCGKTTALRMINRLVEPSAGRVRIDGRDVREVPAHELRRRIGYVIQQVGLLPHLTIADNIATVPRLLGWERPRVDSRVTQMLDLVGLAHQSYARRYPSELSGGQQQRVGLARALAADPPLILMDEPFSALDPITRERLQGDFLALREVVPSTVVFVTHDIDEAVRMGDRIAVMRDGRLHQIADPATLLAHPTDEFVSDFVGADRALKALSLRTVEQMPLRTDGPAATATVQKASTLRTALSAMLAAGATSVAVMDGERQLGILDLHVLMGHQDPQRSAANA